MIFVVWLKLSNGMQCPLFELWVVAGVVIILRDVLVLYPFAGPKSCSLSVGGCCRYRWSRRSILSECSEWDSWSENDRQYFVFHMSHTGGGNHPLYYTCRVIAVNVPCTIGRDQLVLVEQLNLVTWSLCSDAMLQFWPWTRWSTVAHSARI